MKCVGLLYTSDGESVTSSSNTVVLNRLMIILTDFELTLTTTDESLDSIKTAVFYQYKVEVK